MPLSPNKYGAIAITNIVFCFLLVLVLLVPASMGGFNAVAVSMCVTLLTSIVLSFYLLAKRRDLSARVLRRLTAFIVVVTLIGIAPLLVGIGFALAS
jgi:hypothetical protein